MLIEHPSITYNVLNLPQRVVYEGLVLQRPECRIIYDAAGRRHAQLTGYTSQGRFSGDVRLYVGDYIVVNDSVDRLLTPYGYLRDGVFHSYVHDYQDNVTCVVTDDEVLQTNLYYPDGLPMSISTQPAANPIKYTGKELLLFRGYPVYDFTARHTLPALGNIFRTPDPKAEINQHISVYSFCNGDPINYIDPTGETTHRISFDGQNYERIEDNSDFDKITFYSGNNEVSIILDPDILISIEQYKANSDRKYFVMRVRGDVVGQKIFETAANVPFEKKEDTTEDSKSKEEPELNKDPNAKYEYSLWQVGEKGDKGLNIISTSGQKNEDATGAFLFMKQLRYGYTLRRHVHSHILCSIPSGYEGENDADRDFVTHLYNLTSQRPIIEVYTIGHYIRYTPTSTSTELREILNSFK